MTDNEQSNVIMHNLTNVLLLFKFMDYLFYLKRTSTGIFAILSIHSNLNSPILCNLKKIISFQHKPRGKINLRIIKAKIGIVCDMFNP